MRLAFIERLERRTLLSAVLEPNLFGTAPIAQLSSIKLPGLVGVVATAGGALPVIAAAKFGVPLRIDADRSKATGINGDDFEITLSMVKSPQPHLAMQIDRLGVAPFAENVQVLGAAIGAALKNTSAPASTMVFLGAHTTAADDTPGGYLPLSLRTEYLPTDLSGLGRTISTLFDGTALDNPTQVNFGHISIGSGGPELTSFAPTIHWAASNFGNIHLGATTSIQPDNSGLGHVFYHWIHDSVSTGDGTSPGGMHGCDYDSDIRSTTDFFHSLQRETGFPATDPPSRHSEGTSTLLRGTLVCESQSTGIIGGIEESFVRSDGLTLSYIAHQASSHIAATLNLAGGVTLDTPQTIGDLRMQAFDPNGFADSSALFGYPITNASARLVDAPALAASLDPIKHNFTMQTSDPKESAGIVEVVVGNQAKPQVPPAYDALPVHHLFSVVDNGTSGTIVARAVHASSANFRIGSDASQSLALVTSAAAPMQTYLLTTSHSAIVPHDASTVCDIDLVPAADVQIALGSAGEIDAVTNPPVAFGSIHYRGVIDLLSFDVLV